MQNQRKEIGRHFTRYIYISTLRAIILNHDINAYVQKISIELEFNYHVLQKVSYFSVYLIYAAIYEFEFKNHFYVFI